ncbi:hypothetical protein LCGC14_0860420 [marine sediment metagenome]|uniref:Uncharacterized protein n=1 Tax=marine sediment metagenome TaxID=412755 RepID=A0A0F9PCL6_9ZZZZ
MKDHYCLHNKRERKQVFKALRDDLFYWRESLLLRAWDFTLVEVDERPPQVNRTIELPLLYARTYSDPNYKEARIELFVDTEGCTTKGQIELLTCHEILHVMLSPVTDAWETALRQKIDADQFAFVKPLLYGPEEGVCQDLAFRLVELRRNQKPARKKKARPRKAPAGS